jgi:alpha-ketoglutarate-dependent taurine dioxygenase
VTLECVTVGGPAAAWTATHRDDLDARLRTDGLVWLGGAGVTAPADLAAIRDALGRPDAPLGDRFARREAYPDGVYSWPDWAADRDMCLHHEQGYRLRFPGLLVMGALATANCGGAMLLGDTRAVLTHLPTDLAVRFEKHGWTLARNFRPYLGLSWTEAFGTEDASELASGCADEMVGLAVTKDVVRTAQRRSAVVTHPATGDRCWFNDVAFFSQWSVPAQERGVLLSAFGPGGTPFNTFSGDGEPVTEAEYDAIIEAYEKSMVRVEWSAGDVLLVDNILTAHGREPYVGPWDVAVALADPIDLAGCAPTAAPTAVEPK